MTDTPDKTTNFQLERTLKAFDTANAQDPNTDMVNGVAVAKELIYGQRMSEKLHDFCPDASVALQLAARSQHICRWKIPRSGYPMDRQGYKRWRLDLAAFHGETAGEILAANGYNDEIIQRVKDLLLKRSLKRDDEVQALEDVICLVFLEFYMEDFATKHDEEKLIDIIQKTWNKMSNKGHEAALKLPLSQPILTLVGKALNA
ncbi:MAG: DUF4202 domain-containing protein [Pseudomonadota bacterium]